MLLEAADIIAAHVAATRRLAFSWRCANTRYGATAPIDDAPIDAARGGRMCSVVIARTPRGRRYGRAGGCVAHARRGDRYWRHALCPGRSWLAGHVPGQPVRPPH